MPFFNIPARGAAPTKGIEGGLDVYVELHGPTNDDADRDAFPVLNISGTGGDLRHSFPNLSPLNKVFEVAHYDQRGLGQTTKPPGPYSMANYADDACALLDALGWDRAHIVGTSFGGMVAQHLAIRHPERIARLVLNCTSPGGLHPSFPLHTIQSLDVEARIEMRLGLYDNRWDPGRDEPIPGLGRAYDLSIEGMRRQRSPEDQAGYEAQLDARSRHDATSGLPKITAPTLVCAGAYDDLAPPANSERIAAAIPSARLEVFDGGHLFMIQDRSAYRTMIEFLSEAHA